MSRGNQILGAVLVLQLALAAVVFWPRATPAAGGELLFPGVEADQVIRITIADPEEGQIQLAKVQGNWVLPDAGDFPCRADAVPNLLDKLLALKADRLVTETRSSHSRLKVADEDYMREVAFDLADGTRHTLYVGTSPSYSVSHVRVKGQDRVYLASGLAGADVAAHAASWIDTLYLSIPQDEVMAVTLENASGRFEFTKDDAGTWTMAGLAAEETLKTSAVDSLVSRVASVRMTEPLGSVEQDSYGLGAPNATITVQTRDAEGAAQTYVLRVGAKRGEDNSYVVKSSASPYYVEVAEYTVQDWVEKTRDGFLELPPTPTAGS